MFGMIMRESTQRLLERRLAASNGHPSFEGRSACVDYVRRFVLSKVRPRVETIVVAAAATNAIWTLWRLQQAGYLVDDCRCPLCKDMIDTLHHRLWVCKHPEAVRLRRKAASQATIDVAASSLTHHCSITVSFHTLLMFILIQPSLPIMYSST